MSATRRRTLSRLARSAWSRPPIAVPHVDDRPATSGTGGDVRGEHLPFRVAGVRRIGARPGGGQAARVVGVVDAAIPATRYTDTHTVYICGAAARGRRRAGKLGRQPAGRRYAGHSTGLAGNTATPTPASGRCSRGRRARRERLDRDADRAGDLRSGRAGRCSRWRGSSHPIARSPAATPTRSTLNVGQHQASGAIARLSQCG